MRIRIFILLGLFSALNLLAQSASPSQRPSKREVEPILKQASDTTIRLLFAGSVKDTKLNDFQIVDTGSPGWASLPSSDKEIAYWPVRVKCKVLLTPSESSTATQNVGIVYRVWRDDTGNWTADFSDLFDADTLQERAAKLKSQFESLRKAKEVAQKNACLNNLRQIDGAKQQWALENRRKDTDTPTPEDLIRYFYRKEFPTCPAGGVYTTKSVAEGPTCTLPDHRLPKP